MATRAEILFYEEGRKEPIVFYQHWDGYDTPRALARALRSAKKEGLLLDTPVLGSRIFSEMQRIGGKDNIFGISFSRAESTSVTIEVYTSYSEDPEIVFDGELYSAEKFIKEFARKKPAA